MKYISTLTTLLVGISSFAQIYTPGGSVQATTSGSGVGIGTATPSAPLAIHSSGTSALKIQVTNSPIPSPPSGLGGSSSSVSYPIELLFSNPLTIPPTTESVRMRLSASGSLFLGSDFSGFPTGNNRLNVLGTAAFFGTPANYLGFGYSGQIGQVLYWNGGSNTASQKLVIAHGAGVTSTPLSPRTDILTLLPNGNVGIMNTQPGARLSVNDNNVDNSGPTGQVNGIRINNNGVRSHDYALEVNTGHGTILSLSNAGEVFIGRGLNREPIGNYSLWVEKGIRAESLRVDIASSNGWADYVFDEDYEMMSLEELKAYIEERGHLPGVPTQEEVEKDGIDTAEMIAVLLKHVEELNLRIIELNERLIESNRGHSQD